MHSRDPDTDPRVNEPIPAHLVPDAIATARRTIAEVIAICAVIERENGGEIAATARRLTHEAVHFGQIVNFLSAVAIPQAASPPEAPVPAPAPPEVEASAAPATPHEPPAAPRGWAKARAIWRLLLS